MVRMSRRYRVGCQRLDSSIRKAEHWDRHCLAGTEHAQEVNFRSWRPPFVRQQRSAQISSTRSLCCWRAEYVHGIAAAAQPNSWFQQLLRRFAQAIPDMGRKETDRYLLLPDRPKMAIWRLLRASLK